MRQSRQRWTKATGTGLSAQHWWMQRLAEPIPSLLSSSSKCSSKTAAKMKNSRSSTLSISQAQRRQGKLEPLETDSKKVVLLTRVWLCSDSASVSLLTKRSASRKEPSFLIEILLWLESFRMLWEATQKLSWSAPSPLRPSTTRKLSAHWDTQIERKRSKTRPWSTRVLRKRWSESLGRRTKSSKRFSFRWLRAGRSTSKNLEFQI